MAVVQSTYNTEFPIGIVGQIINGETSNRITRTVETAAGVDFGQPLYRGAHPHGAVIGGTFAGTAAAVAGSGNTGNGTMGAITVSAGAKQGVYQLQITGAASNAGSFAVYDPDGLFVDDGDVAAAFSAGGLAFTLADGATDFVVGDSFAITVTYTANIAFLGLAILDHTVPATGTAANADEYPQYANANIMTQGSMVVTAGATVAAGDPVYWNPAALRYTNTATHIRIPNAVFDRAGTDGALTVVTLKNRVI